MSNSRGFTLLELLIGMTLLGFMLALLFGGFRLAASSWNAFEDRAERAADEQAGRSAIRRLVANVQPIHFRQTADQALAFVGQSNTLRMMAPLSGQMGLRVVELSIEPDDSPDNPGGVRLVLRHGPVRYLAEEFIESGSDQPGHPVIEGLSEASFQYFGAEKRDDAPKWQEVWLNPNQFPQLVRLHLAPRNGTALDLDMPTMINGDWTATVRVTAGPR